MSIDPQRQRRRLIGIGFVLAFALSTATLIYTGLNVRAPRSADNAAAPGSAAPGGDPAGPQADAEVTVPEEQTVEPEETAER